MKESIQNKINNIHVSATSAPKAEATVKRDSTIVRPTNNNLSISIRNAKEAEAFYEELKFAIERAKAQ